MPRSGGSRALRLAGVSSFRVLDAASPDLLASEDIELAQKILREADVDPMDMERARVLDLIEDHLNIAERTCRPGHLTGSAFVVDPAFGRALLMFHRKLQMWLQPGGHADGDMNLAHVALREATEETGIDGLFVVTPAIDVDIHRVDPPKEDAHLHLDVRFLVLAPPGAVPKGNHESEALKWVDEKDFDDFAVDDGTKRMAKAGFALARRL